MSTAEKVPELAKIQLPGADRDAVHIALVKMMAGDRLSPGAHVGFTRQPAEIPKLRRATGGVRGIGVVDPFLTQPVEPGEWVYVMLYPKTVKGMRHTFSHEALDQLGELSESSVDDREIEDPSEESCSC